MYLPINNNKEIRIRFSNVSIVYTVFLLKRRHLQLFATELLKLAIWMVSIVGNGRHTYIAINGSI